MSSRAIRAIRGDDYLQPLGDFDSEGEDDADDEPTSGAHSRKGKGLTFTAIIQDDESEDESEEEPDDSVPRLEKETARPTQANNVEVSDSRVEEDLDAIIGEFIEQDDDRQEILVETKNKAHPISILLKCLDQKDLDIDYSMHNALAIEHTNQSQTRQNKTNRGRRNFLFGTARDGWTKPPNYIGGGIGMTTYDNDPQPIPWPYCDLDDERARFWSEKQRWHRFVYSDSYEKEINDFQMIQASGDFNALVLFIIHHPFVTDALFQVSNVLSQTNHSQEALSLLRRCIWVYESSALFSFTKELDAGSFMDFSLAENATFFRALTRLIKVSNIAGLQRTAFGVSRFLLALDPLRDPMKVLVVIDNYCLACQSSEYDNWLVEFVESEALAIYHREATSNREYSCRLLDMPNWAFSYALALFRLYRVNPTDEGKEKANKALQYAMARFPLVPGLLLKEQDVDTSGRSFRTDWVTVLDYFESLEKRLRRNEFADNDVIEVVSAAQQTVHKIILIYVQHSAKLWGEEDVLIWMYDNMKTLKMIDPDISTTLSPALIRYADTDPTDFETRFETLPAEANVIDPGLLRHAMVVEGNRPRFLRRLDQRHNRAGDDIPFQDQGVPPAPQIFGPPTHRVDADWPMLEVFWRSFLPWNHVEGVPPPRR